MEKENQQRVIVIAPEAPGLQKLDRVEEFAGLSALAGVELQFVAGNRATLDAISAALLGGADIVVWAGHGGPNQLMAADGVVDGEWLASQLGYAPPRVAIIAACFSAQADETLESITNAISEGGIDCIGMTSSIADGAAILFTREFVRARVAGAGVATARRVAAKMVQRKYPDGRTIELVPGLRNGTRAMAQRVRGIEARLDAIEKVIDRLQG